MKILFQSEKEGNNKLNNQDSTIISQLKKPYNHFSLKIWMCFFILMLIKLSLVSGQKLYATTGNLWDDALFINLARNILEGNWLGNFNNLTFVKGCFYPIWIAVCHIIGLPLLTAENLLWAFACIIFVIAIRPIIRNNYYIIFSYAFLLFIPASFALQTMTTVKRDGIYSSLTLIIIASTIAIFLRKNSSLKKTMTWSVILGISLSSFWLTREEGLWIIPLLFVIFVFHMILIIKNHNNNASSVSLKRTLVLVLPFLILALSILSTTTINYLKYGEFITVEFKSKNFLSAYGALTRVKPKEWEPDVSLPKETRMRIYKVCPSFSKLKQYLEGDVGIFWLWVSNFHVSYFHLSSSCAKNNEIRTGIFVWALRDAVAAAGYYQNATMADTYYERLGKEINLACDNGELECYAGKRATMIPVWHNEYIIPLLKKFLDGAVFVISCDGIWEKPISGGPSKDIKALRVFSDITREKLSSPNDKIYFPIQSMYDGIKLNLLKKINKAYVFTMPILTLLSIIVLVLLLIFRFKEASYTDMIVISFGLISIFILRLLLLSFLDISSFPAINIRFLSPLHPVLASFIILMFYNSKHILNELAKVLKNLKSSEEPDANNIP